MEANILRILVVLVGVALVAVVLIQQPKEGGMGAFTGGGGGASGTVFGAKGSGSFLFKLTAALALAFAIAIGTLVAVTNDKSDEAVLTQPAATTTTLPSAESTPADKTVIPGADKVKTTQQSAVPGAAQPAEETAIPGAGQPAEKAVPSAGQPAAKPAQ